MWTSFEAIVATSHRVEKYGGYRLSDTALQEIVDEVNAGRLPLIGHHDWTQPLQTRDIVAELVIMDDGEHGVRVTGLVNSAEWDGLGQIGGMSFTAFEPLATFPGPDSAAGESVLLAADAGWFDDDSIREASRIIGSACSVDGRRLLQFSAVDQARIVLEVGLVAWQTFGPNIVSSALWDGLKYLLASRRNRADAPDAPSRIELKADIPAGEVMGIVDSADPDVVKAALSTFSDAVGKVADVHGSVQSLLVWHDTGGAEGSWQEHTARE